MLRFHIYDVFTDTPFSGNPLAIVEGADALSPAQMQIIARQFNLSETIFVQTPEDPANTAKVRIFFPTDEIPFAGHPTVGCALHLAGGKPGTIRLEEQAGLVPVTITPDGVAEFTAPKRPRVLHRALDRDLAARAVGLSAQDLGPHSVGVFEGGPCFAYIPVRDLDALARARPMLPAWADFLAAASTPTDAVDAAYLYAPGPETTYQARVFAPEAGIPEDPATGSATAIFAGQLLTNGALPSGNTTLTLAQGVEMGRPARLRLSADVDGDAKTLTAIRVAGQAVHVASGEIRIPPAP